MNLVKNILSSFVVAFSMYSKIPMPHIEWKKQHMQYALCFFPWIGLVIGLCQFGWYQLGSYFAFGPFFMAAGFTVIPIVITGGIHLDGYLDTADALSSWREKERRLEILKDSHAGAFAIIMGAVYFVLYFGAATEINDRILPVLCLTYTMSRCFSALSVVHFPNANPKGTAAMFGKNAYRRVVTLIMMFYLIALVVGGILLSPVYMAVITATVLLSFLYYRYMSDKYFGGITGDLAGFFVSTTELAVLLVLVITSKCILL